MVESWAAAAKQKRKKKEEMVPDERHITYEQREELRKIGEEVVERQTVKTLKMSGESARKIIGRQFAFLWG